MPLESHDWRVASCYPTTLTYGNAVLVVPSFRAHAFPAAQAIPIEIDFVTGGFRDIGIRRQYSPANQPANVAVSCFFSAILPATSTVSDLNFETGIAGLSVEQEARDEILSRLHMAKVSTGATGTEGEVLESLGRISLDGWRMRNAALSQLFAQAKAKADGLGEPKIRHVKLGSVTLRTPDEVSAWIEKTERELLDQIQQRPIAIG